MKFFKKLYRNKKGFTLVELMVSFTLTAIFMTAAVLVMSSFLKVYYRTNNISQSNSVADMLMESITSELSLAAAAPYEDTHDSNYLIITCGENADQVSYRDKNKNKVDMSVNDEGRLHLYYSPQLENVTDPGEGIDWEYKQEVYLNNKITELTFTKGDGNVITVSMTLHNDKTGYSVHSQRAIECYNLDGPNIVERK